jgi:hypothetical protein
MGGGKDKEERETGGQRVGVANIDQRPVTGDRR